MQLARELYKAGKFKSVLSARTCMQYNSTGKNKSIDYELLEYLKKRFNKTTDQIIN